MKGVWTVSFESEINLIVDFHKPIRQKNQKKVAFYVYSSTPSLLPSLSLFPEINASNVSSFSRNCHTLALLTTRTLLFMTQESQSITKNHKKKGQNKSHNDLGVTHFTEAIRNVEENAINLFYMGFSYKIN